MKIDEFIKKANEVAYAVEAVDGIIEIATSEENLCSHNYFLFLNPKRQDLLMVYDWSFLGNVSFTTLFYIFNLVEQLEETPVKERFPEKKYRLRFAGLNSDNGKQYLSCRHMNSNFFACALRSDLKQEFAKDEIDTLMNKPQFKSIPWFKELIREGIEEVPDDER